MNSQLTKLGLSFFLLLMAAVAPNVFVLAQAGFASFSDLATDFLLPSVFLLFAAILVAYKLHLTELVKLSINGMKAGVLATIALEIVRETGFHIGFMPGDLPRLMGVLLLDQFALGPDWKSDIVGWLYHFWNGATFGIIFSLVFGQSRTIQGIWFGLCIALGFMISPVVKSLGIGLFGKDFKDGYQFAATVVLAHLAFGILLSLLLQRWNKSVSPIWRFWKPAFVASKKPTNAQIPNGYTAAKSGIKTFSEKTVRRRNF